MPCGSIFHAVESTDTRNNPRPPVDSGLAMRGRGIFEPPSVTVRRSRWPIRSTVSEHRRLAVAQPVGHQFAGHQQHRVEQIIGQLAAGAGSTASRTSRARAAAAAGS